MGQKKVEQFSALGSKTSSIAMENPEGEEAEGIEGQPGARGDNKAAEGEDTKWAEGNKRFEDEGGAGVQHQHREGQTVEWRYTGWRSPKRNS